MQPAAQADALQQIFREHAIRAVTKRQAEQNIFLAGVALQQIEGLKNVAGILRAKMVALRLAEIRNAFAIETNCSGIGLQTAGN